MKQSPTHLFKDLILSAQRSMWNWDFGDPKGTEADLCSCLTTHYWKGKIVGRPSMHWCTLIHFYYLGFVFSMLHYYYYYLIIIVTIISLFGLWENIYAYVCIFASSPSTQLDWHLSKLQVARWTASTKEIPLSLYKIINTKPKSKFIHLYMIAFGD